MSEQRSDQRYYKKDDIPKIFMPFRLKQINDNGEERTIYALCDNHLVIWKKEDVIKLFESIKEFYSDDESEEFIEKHNNEIYKEWEDMMK